MQEPKKEVTKVLFPLLNMVENLSGVSNSLNKHFRAKIV